MMRHCLLTGLLCIGCAAVRAQGLGLDHWEKGRHDWRYRGDQFGVALGRSPIRGGLADTQVALGGIRLDSRLGGPRPTGPSWDLSLAAGAIDRNPEGTTGDLSYGALASQGEFSVRPSQKWLLHSDVQSAPGLLASTVGTQVDSGDFGTLGLGVGHGRQGAMSGWAYQTRYSVRIWKGVDVSWQSDRQLAGYSDLASYQRGGGQQDMTRRQVTAGLTLSDRSSVSGSYETVRQAGGGIHRRFGITRQVWYSPNVKLGFKAEREIRSGDYDVGLSLSIPIK
ncbi:MAG TPA: hypothetical protein VK104_03270 [Burkholderiaceae bacterium]|nr:hypothetical protein [Burkholderiaceae bacterium]